MRLSPLHISTEFSFNESVIKIDKLIKQALNNKVTSLVITDHNVMFGVSEFVHKTKKVGIKPIIGLDLDVEDYRFILLAKNYKGYIFLNSLSTKKSWEQEIQLNDINSLDLFIIDHPTKGYFAKTNKKLNWKNYFIGTTKDSFDNSVFLQEGKILKKEDKKSLEIMSKMVKKELNLQNIYPLLFSELNKDIKLINNKKILDQCNIDWNNVEPILPTYKNDYNIKSIDYLKKIIKQNSNKILLNKQNKKEYENRLKYEISIIKKLKFEDYFLIIWDLINWSKKNSILIGPGRGSVAGSLVAYFLNITEVDPLEFDLIFERFLNPERITMPDIDIDIQDNKREEVINYIFNKYGKNNVGLISTFSKLGPKSSIRDVARLMDIPIREVNVISKLIPNDLNLENAYKESSRFRALIDSKVEYEKLFKWSKMIEGLTRQVSTHAAGIVISNKNLINKVATIKGVEGHNQIQYPMDYLEENKLLKIDLLGLRNLTIIKNIQKEIYKNHNKKVNLKKISYKDIKTNQLLTNADTNGIFQLESYGMKETLKKIKVSSIDDIVAILSLYRPGPMDNINIYAAIKNKTKEIKKIEPKYDNITKNTCGIIIYQEQIMQIAQEFSKMSFGQADILRRAIGKKKSNLINALKKTFINKALKEGHSLTLSENIYSIIEKFANYGFNKSHAVGYSMISYRMAYLKAHFPFEFYTSVLNSCIYSKNSSQKYIEETKLKKIKIVAPNINDSEFTVINKDKKIFLPLQFIKGFGDIGANKILKERQKSKFIDFFDFITRTKLINLGDRNIEILIESNSLREFGNAQTLLNSLPSANRYANMVIVKKDNNNFIDYTIMPKPKMIKSNKNIELEIFNDKKYLGFQINNFITKKYEKEFNIININENEKKEVVFLIETFKITKTKYGKKMAIMDISDSTKRITVMIFENILKLIKEPKLGQVVIGIIECKNFKNKLTYTINKPWKEITHG